jgi:hypothetical protein
MNKHSDLMSTALAAAVLAAAVLLSPWLTRALEGARDPSPATHSLARQSPAAADPACVPGARASRRLCAERRKDVVTAEAGKAF